MSTSKYIIGIDLGTTHCVLAYTPVPGPEEEAQEIRIFDIPQVVSPGEVHAGPLLPSFLFLPGPHEVPEQGLALPWDPERSDYAVGTFARDRGAELPQRLFHRRAVHQHRREQMSASIVFKYSPQSKVEIIIADFMFRSPPQHIEVAR